eukprot:2671049-Rhodomonas_salina.1
MGARMSASPQPAAHFVSSRPRTQSPPATPRVRVAHWQARARARGSGFLSLPIQSHPVTVTVTSKHHDHDGILAPLGRSSVITEFHSWYSGLPCSQLLSFFSLDAES